MVCCGCPQVLGLEDNAISSWQEVLRLAGLPRLQRLALSGNPIRSITYPASSISLAALYSSSPPDTESTPQPAQQQQADGPGALPACPTPLQCQQEQPQPAFASLQALLLGDCQISSWADVHQLNKFPSLRELRLSGNPLFSAEGCGAGAGRRFEVSRSVGH
jgi:Leucine-rich repeat (LRR) protein